MYNKIFTKILDSSIWLESDTTRLIWFTFLAAMDEEGFCQFASVANLAHRARVNLDAAKVAIECLEGPDENSSDPDHEGRRIERVPGGWIVMNAAKYRELVTRVIIKEKTRERVARHRAKKNGVTECNAPVTEVNGEVTPSGKDSDSKKDSETKAKKKKASERGMKFAEWFRTLLPEGQRLLGDWKTSWATTYDELLRLDNRTEKEIADVCKWARQNSFWSQNLLSPVKLRKSDDNGVCYFDRIIAAKNAPPRINGNAPKPKPAPVYEESRMNREVRELMEEEERKQKARLAAEKEKSK